MYISLSCLSLSVLLESRAKMAESPIYRIRDDSWDSEQTFIWWCTPTPRPPQISEDWWLPSHLAVQPSQLSSTVLCEPELTQAPSAML